MSQQGSDIPFIEVEAEVVHCSFGSINFCYAMEGDSQGEVSGFWFHVRVWGTFDNKEKGQEQLLHCSRCCSTYLRENQNAAKVFQPGILRTCHQICIILSSLGFFLFTSEASNNS